MMQYKLKSISKYSSLLVVGSLPLNALELNQMTTEFEIFIPYVIIFVLILSLFIVLQKYRSIIKQKDDLIAKHEEKIKWFRQITAENEHKKTSREHQSEKEILELNHTIENLEQKVKEGEKNQIVSKIEMYQERRRKLFERAGMEMGG